MASKALCWLILPDIHFPHHDESALECVLAIKRRVKPDRIVQLGDALDCGAFSAHGRASVDDIGADFLSEEIAPYNTFLDRLQGKARTPLYHLEGNHENRVQRWLANAAGSVAGSIAPLLSVETLLRNRVGESGNPRRPRENFTWVPYIGKGFHSHLRIAPNLLAIHGWSVAQNAAKAHFDKVRNASVVHGHTHRAQNYTMRNPLTNDVYHAWSPGCLCDFVPIYMANSPSDWTHGITLLYQSYTNPSDWSHYNVTIVNGRAILPDGREVAAA